MDTVVNLDVYSDYYYYDDGTETSKAATMRWPTNKSFPLLQPGVRIQIKNTSYKVTNVIVVNEDKQIVTCYAHIGYNRYREEQLKKLTNKGWVLEKEYE